MLQLVAGFLVVPVSIKFLIPPGSTYFTRVDAVTTGDPHGSSWQVEDAHASPTHREPLPSPSAARPLRPDLS